MADGTVSTSVADCSSDTICMAANALGDVVALTTAVWCEGESDTEIHCVFRVRFRLVVLGVVLECCG